MEPGKPSISKVGAVTDCAFQLGGGSRQKSKPNKRNSLEVVASAVGEGKTDQEWGGVGWGGKGGEWGEEGWLRV